MNRPVLTPIAPGRWRLADEWQYFGFTIPAGFVCDLDSVPRLPFIHARYQGRTVIAAVLHDYLYRHRITSRRVADLLFLLAMEFEGVPWRFQIAIYLAVRCFGWSAWRRNRRK